MLRLIIFLVMGLFTPILVSQQYNADIAQAQSDLEKFGCDPGPTDGRFGEKTRSALRRFQESQQNSDIKVTGNLDGATQNLLKEIGSLATNDKKCGSILILNTQEFPPYHFASAQSQAMVSGPVADVVVKVCQRAKLNCLVKLKKDWAEAQQEVKDNRAHGLFVISWDSNRDKYLCRPKHRLAQAEYGLFKEGIARNEQQQISLTDFGGLTVGVYGPSGTSMSLEQIPNNPSSSGGVEIYKPYFSDSEKAFDALAAKDGRITAVYSNKEVGETIIEKRKLSNIYYIGFYTKISYYIGFLKNGKIGMPVKICDDFDDAYEYLYKENAVREIFGNYRMTPPDLN